jgi:dihydrofolate reductase
MRKLIVYNRITPEGWFASANGQLDWVVPDDDADRAGVEAMPSADLMLFGRKTYEMFRQFWPTVADHPEPPDPHQPGRATPALRDFARWINATAKLVVSTTLGDPGWRNARVMPGFDPAAIAEVKRAPGKAIMVFGSGRLVGALVEHGLVDELQLVVNPLLLGGGAPLFPGLSHRVPLALVACKPYASGNVMLHYALGGVR